MNKAIELFKEKKIDIFEAIKNLDTMNYTSDEIKENGIVYTPKYIADYIISNLNIKDNETVLEPSVGHGIFIFALLELNKSKKNLKEWFLKNIHGFDIQSKNIDQLKELLIIYFNHLNIKLTKQELTNFKVMDTLFESKEHFDVIFGNPPYIRLKNLDPIYASKLKSTYKSCKEGNIDIYYAFIEFSIKHSTKCSFIVPNSYLYNKFAKTLREIISENVTEIIDFKEKKIFEKVGTYTSIFFNNKEEKKEDILYKESLDVGFKNIKKTDFFKREIKNENEDFNILAIYGPIATLRDSIFKNFNSVEIKDTVPFLKLTKFKTRDEVKKNKDRIIFPYKLIDSKFVLKKEKGIGDSTLCYLMNNKEELLKRDKGNKTYPNWYAYGRTQGLHNFNNRDTAFIIIPGMFSENYKFFKFEKDDIKEEQFLFSSGLLIEIDKTNEELVSYLNTKIFFEKVKQIATVKPGKNPYYSLSKPQLENILIKNNYNK